MDTTQLTQMVNWLDEELRRERSEVTKLQQLVERQSGELTEQARQLKDLEGHLANTRAQLTKFTQLEESLRQLKSEVVLMFDKREEHGRAEQREAEILRMSDRETLATSVSELRRDLGRLAPYDEELRIREAEDLRLGEMLMSLRHEVAAMGKDFDERARNLSYLAEQRAYDNKRIGGLQEESLSLLKRTEKQDTRAKSLEDASLRHERHVQELLQAMSELKLQQGEWTQSQALAGEQRKREMALWLEQVEAQREDAQSRVDRMEAFSDTVASGRQALASLETFKEQLRRDQNQVAELQRLAEERQRKELEEWQVEDEKRWRKHELQWEHQWKEQYERHNALMPRFTALEDDVTALQQQVLALWRLHEVYGAHRIADVQRWQAELAKAVGERDKLERKRQ